MEYVHKQLSAPTPIHVLSSCLGTCSSHELLRFVQILRTVQYSDLSFSILPPVKPLNNLPYPLSL
ncbi:hypothetical protein GQ44DRAFT_455525 [Phaeosphaeriaceae sp. PMI808]|nr:hypothetical protein GQ44DRAFT_455525 [Phaeosphaeriaceae sp. PMI808]